MIKQYKLRFYNFRLMLFLLAVSSIGVVLVSAAREDLKYRQLAGVIVGVIIMVILSLMDYSWILNFQWIMYGANIVLLLLVRFFWRYCRRSSQMDRFWFYPFSAY